MTGASHLGVSLTPVPLASPGSPRGDSPGGAELATRLSTGSRRSPLSPAGDWFALEDRPSPARTSACAVLRGDFPLVAQNDRGERVLDDLGCGAEKARRTWGRPPAGLCPPKAETQARAYLGREWGAAWASGAKEKLVRTSRGRRGRGGPAGSGSLGSGTHSAAPGPRAPRARCVSLFFFFNHFASQMK